MTSKLRFKRQKSKLRLKSLGLLIFILIIPIIINSSLMGLLDKGTNFNEKEFIEEPHIFPSSNDPPNSNYFDYFKDITIDHTKVSGSGNLTNFPLLISIYDSDLHDNVQSIEGNDIAFALGDAWLDYEIEVFDQTYNPKQAH